MFETTNQLYVCFTDMWAIFGGKWGEWSHLLVCHTWNGRCALQVLGRPILRQNSDWLKTQQGNIYGWKPFVSVIESMLPSLFLGLGQSPEIHFWYVLLSCFYEHLWVNSCRLAPSSSGAAMKYNTWLKRPTKKAGYSKLQELLESNKIVSFKKYLESFSSTRRLALDSWILHTGQAPKKNETYFLQIPKSVLVCGIPTPLKNRKVSWDSDIPNAWKVIKLCKNSCSKTPTRLYPNICRHFPIITQYI